MGGCGGLRLAWMAGSIGGKGIRMLIRLLIAVKWIGDRWVVGGEGGLGEKNLRLLKLENM